MTVARRVLLRGSDRSQPSHVQACAWRLSSDDLASSCLTATLIVFAVMFLNVVNLMAISQNEFDALTALSKPLVATP